jgi:hypothetical protein
MQFRVKFDLKKFERDIEAESRKKAQEQISKLSNTELLSIGDAAVDQMQIAIVKGLSPIKGNGRFAAYKWSAKKSEQRKSKTKSGKQLKREFQNRYPYSEMKKHPDKKERPVNLKLSGEFLSNLKAFIKGKELWIGFKDDTKWAKYESGHREGVHGQPKRPIIPSGAGEQFSDSILRRLVKQVQAVFDKKK